MSDGKSHCFGINSLQKVHGVQISTQTDVHHIIMLCHSEKWSLRQMSHEERGAFYINFLYNIYRKMVKKKKKKGGGP